MYLPNPGRGQASWSEAALRVASRRAKFIPPLEAEGFLWLFCNFSQKFSRNPVSGMGCDHRFGQTIICSSCADSSIRASSVPGCIRLNTNIPKRICPD